jgi:Transglycosylase SLT domain
MERLARIGPASAVRGVCLLVLVLFSMGAKTGVEPLNFHASWKTYAQTDAGRQPLDIYPYDACFRKAAKDFNLPLTLLLALARGESDFNPKAKSSQSCYGIMQIQWPGTATDLGFKSIKELYDPCKNIRAGAKYLRKMLDRYKGDIHLALAAYNYGPGRIAVGAEVIPQGADWYSGYIYHHLKEVLARSSATLVPPAHRQVYKRKNKLAVVIFHNPLRAEGFLAYFKENAPDLRLDWFRTNLGETYIVLLYSTEKEKTGGIAKLRQLGFTVDPTIRFY